MILILEKCLEGEGIKNYEYVTDTESKCPRIFFACNDSR